MTLENHLSGSHPSCMHFNDQISAYATYSKGKLAVYMELKNDL